MKIEFALYRTTKAKMKMIFQNKYWIQIQTISDRILSELLLQIFDVLVSRSVFLAEKQQIQCTHFINFEFDPNSDGTHDLPHWCGCVHYTCSVIFYVNSQQFLHALESTRSS